MYDGTGMVSLDLENPFTFDWFSIVAVSLTFPLPMPLVVLPTP